MPQKTTKVLRISAKCSDLFSAQLMKREQSPLGVATSLVGEYDGYVPKFFPGEHFGDYVELDIDVATGQILNWVPPTKTQLKETFPESV